MLGHIDYEISHVAPLVKEATHTSISLDPYSSDACNLNKKIVPTR